MSEQSPTPPRLKTGFYSMTHRVLARTAKSVAKGLTNNTSLSNPPIPVETLTANADAYSAAVDFAERDEGKQATADRDQWRPTIVKDLRLTAAYVESAANGDVAVLTSSGFPLASTTRTPSGPLATPTEVRLKQGISGQLMGKTRCIDGTRRYEFRIAPLVDGLPSDWRVLAVTTIKSWIPFDDLTPGITYAVQVRAFGASGFTDWSPTATRMCI